MSHISLPRVRRIALIALGTAIAALMVAVFYANRDSASANHSPANKVWVAADSLEIMNSRNTPGAQESSHVVLAQGRGKFSNPTDLRLSVTSECALWTNTAVKGDDDAETKARVEVWVTIDGKTVPVTTDHSDPATNNGKDPSPPATPLLGGSVDPDVQGPEGHVVFCNRANRMTTENFPDTADDPKTTDVDESENNPIIRSYNRSRSANGFNWAALDVGRKYDTDYKCDTCTQSNGKGEVLIEVHARLATQILDGDPSDNEDEAPTGPSATDSPAAKAAVGKRTLFVEPVKMANDATF